MLAPIHTRPSRPDTEVIRIPTLSDWLSLAAASDSTIWAAYADYKTAERGAQK